MIDKMNEYFSVDQLAEMYHIKSATIRCDQCRFCNAPTIDIGAQVCYCMYWCQKMRCSNFCNHYMPKVEVKL